MIQRPEVLFAVQRTPSSFEIDLRMLTAPTPFAHHGFDTATQGLRTRSELAISRQRFQESTNSGERSMAVSKALRGSVTGDLRKSASTCFGTSPTRPAPRPAPESRVSPTSRNEPVALVAEIDGSPVLIRFLLKDLPAQTRLDDGHFVTEDLDIHSLLSSALGKTPETVLRVGSLELDLVDRTAKRGDRPINLLPREFELLRYMMRRSNQLLTRAALFKEVWHYKFVPESNLVDVHIGRLRRKVDGSDEVPMIRTVRGAGFVLTASAPRAVRIDQAIGMEPAV
jgi:DNA-binding winged helix-turn-helix (wHTH) protein